MKPADEQRIAVRLAKLMAMICVRNTGIEELNAGTISVTHTGDYSDVLITDADGRRIPWSDASHIDDDQMRSLMRKPSTGSTTFTSSLTTRGSEISSPERFGAAIDNRAMASPGVIGAVGRDRTDLFMLGKLRQQVWKQWTVALSAGREFDGADIAGLRVHADMDLAPLPAARRTKLACQPLAIAAEFDAPRRLARTGGAYRLDVSEQGHGAVRAAIGDLHRKPRLAAARRVE